MNAKDFLDEFKNERDFNKVIAILGKDKKLSLELLQLVEIKSEYPYSEYASWIWTHICKDLTNFAQDFYPTLVDILFETKNESVLRNILAGIVHLEKTIHREGELIDLLFQFLLEKSHKVALHVYTIYVLLDFLKKYPELKQELILSVDLLLENASPALLVASKRLKKSVQK